MTGSFDYTFHLYYHSHICTLAKRDLGTCLRNSNHRAQALALGLTRGLNRRVADRFVAELLLLLAEIGMIQWRHIAC